MLPTATTLVLSLITRCDKCPFFYSLSLRDEALVQVNDVVANEPDQVGEVGGSRLVVNVLQHSGVAHWGWRGGGERINHFNETETERLSITTINASTNT